MLPVPSPAAEENKSTVSSAKRRFVNPLHPDDQTLRTLARSKLLKTSSRVAVTSFGDRVIPCLIPLEIGNYWLIYSYNIDYCSTFTVYVLKQVNIGGVDVLVVYCFEY